MDVPPESIEIITKVVGMLHTASLLVDDVEDSSILRRGVHEVEVEQVVGCVSAWGLVRIQPGRRGSASCRHRIRHRTRS